MAFTYLGSAFKLYENLRKHEPKLNKAMWILFAINTAFLIAVNTWLIIYTEKHFVTDETLIAFIKAYNKIGPAYTVVNDLYQYWMITSQSFTACVFVAALLMLRHFIKSRRIS